MEGSPQSGSGGSITNTVTFSSPVLNPVLAVWSLGNNSGGQGQWLFNQPFTLLSYGAGTYPYAGGSVLTVGPTNSLLLTGSEGYGVIQFSGEVSSISWTVPETEYYNGFTVGVPVPLPASLGLLLAGVPGLAGIGWSLRRNQKAAEHV